MKHPEPHSDLAMQTLKDPYNFDFLTLWEEHDDKIRGCIAKLDNTIFIRIGNRFFVFGWTSTYKSW